MWALVMEQCHCECSGTSYEIIMSIPCKASLKDHKRKMNYPLIPSKVSN